MGRPALAIVLSEAERQELDALARAHKTGQAIARRARIVLAAASGLDNKTICSVLGTNANTVSTWRRRFAADRLDGSVRNFVCERAVSIYAPMARMKRSPNRTANCAFAIDHSRGGIFHSFSCRFKIR